MKVLLVNGSPRKNGCIHTALSIVADALEQEGIDTEIYWLGYQAVGGCIACRTCAKTGWCIIDDQVNTFREKAYETDGFVFGSPVHYASASGNLTAFMDRLFFSERHGNQSTAFRLNPRQR